MPKAIGIIGGGISGLALLHELNKVHASHPDISITLWESHSQVGGTIHTHSTSLGLLETGPNGFLPEKSTLDFIDELGAADFLIEANSQSKIRYICVDGQLCKVPLAPWDVLGFSPLTFLQRLRIFGELFVSSRSFEHETLYDFCARRFGQGATEYLVDPAVSGIFAGNISDLNVKESFPKLVQMEEECGSVITGMIRKMKEKRKSGLPRQMHSFRGGMGTLINHIHGQYTEQIQLGEEIHSIKQFDQGYKVIGKKTHVVDELFICTPAHQTTHLLRVLNPNLSTALRQIKYAPVAVVGLIYPKASLPEDFNGFGYLIPSHEENMVLGVLCESNVFEGRAQEDSVLFRVMLGGDHHEEIVNYSEEQIKALAKAELLRTLHITDEPMEQLFRLWDKAIPQYNQHYPHWKKTIQNELEGLPSLYLHANYLDGISMNDCIKNAREMVQHVHNTTF